MNEILPTDSASFDAFSGASGLSVVVIIFLLCSLSFFLGILVGRKMAVSKSSSGRGAENDRREKHVVDYDNVIGSAFEARPFAKKLKVLCHPDRFVDNEVKRKLAEVLHQEVVENSHNLNELKLLERRIQDELLDA